MTLLLVEIVKTLPMAVTAAIDEQHPLLAFPHYFTFISPCHSLA